MDKNHSGDEQMQMKEVRAWGNSGGVLLPREWIGKQVKIMFVDRSSEIKKEVLKILEPWLEEVIGVYLVGSYSRGEQTRDSDIDILVITKKTKRAFTSGIYEIEMMPLKDLMGLLIDFPAAIYPKILDAKSIINGGFLEEIREKVKITRKSMDPYMESCRKKLKLHKRLIKDDEKKGKYLKTFAVLYSVVLRLKAFYLMKSILSKEEHTNKSFKKYLISQGGISDKQFEDIYNTYRAVARKKKIKFRITLESIKSLVNLLEKEVKAWNGEKKKEA